MKESTQLESLEALRKWTPEEIASDKAHYESIKDRYERCKPHTHPVVE